MASRVCQKLADRVGDAYNDELRSAANMYEDLAIGVLDEVTDPYDAVQILVGVRTRTSICKKQQHLWTHSVLDEAVGYTGDERGNGDASYERWRCRRFVSHRHCQFTLGQFFAGTLPSTSPACIIDQAPRTLPQPDLPRSP